MKGRELLARIVGGATVASGIGGAGASVSGLTIEIPDSELDLRAGGRIVSKDGRVGAAGGTSRGGGAWMLTGGAIGPP
jgi:hypothetical protein